MTDRVGVFAGGDCQMGAKTIIECVAQGKLAARAMHGYLMGEDMKEVARRLELGRASSRPLRYRALQASRAKGEDADAALRGPHAQLQAYRTGLP